MSFSKLPDNANVENLGKRAKSLLKAVKAGDADALHRVGPYFGNPSNIGLQSAQLVLAREYGFSSWLKLKNHVVGLPASAAASVDEPPLTDEQLANQFLDLVVVHLSPMGDIGPERFDKALKLLEQHSQIRTHSIYTAAAIGDIDELGRWLADSTDGINEKGGFFNWSPLMYACYARLPGHSTLAAAKMLLDNGADANPYYLSFGQYKFTALTGVFGQGEGGPVNQPEHPDYLELARYLLDCGANANDSQAAYNRCFEPDNSCLELLLEYGLNASDKNNWLLCEDDKLMPNPSETMHFHLIQAIHRGFAERARLLIDHGVDIEKADDTYETRTKGKTPLQAAMILGEAEIASYLIEAGADTSVLTVDMQFQQACSTGDRIAAKELLETDPDLVAGLQPIHREMMCDAVKRGRRQAIELMLELGFELNDNSGRTPLHEAALGGDVEMIQYLLDAGADAALRDPEYLVPAIGYALHSNQSEAVELLDKADMDIFTAAIRGNLAQLQRCLEQLDGNVNVRFATVRPVSSKAGNDQDWMTPLVFAVMGNKLDIVQFLVAAGADLNVSDGQGQDLLTLAERQGCSGEIIEIVSNPKEQK